MLQLIKRLRRSLIESRYTLGARFRRSNGTVSTPRSTPVIVTLTSYGVRLNTVHLTIESILSQSSRADRIILWQSRSLNELPATLTRLLNRGLEIRQVTDLGPVTKVLYAAREFPDAVLVTADDDLIYPRRWLEALLAEHHRSPAAIVCHRAHLMTWASQGLIAPYNAWGYGAPNYQGPSLMLFPTGVSGVLYPPRSLHPDVVDITVNQAICRSNDDVWLKAMSLRNGTACVKVAPQSRDFYTIRGTQDAALWRTNSESANDIQLQAVFDRYAIPAHLWSMTSGERSDG